MGAVRIIILVVAAVAAIILALIVGKLVSHKPQPAPIVAAAPIKPMTKVVVASHDLAIGSRLAAADLTWQDWPIEAVNPAFITDGRGAVTSPQSATAVVATQTGRVAADAVNAVTGAQTPMDALYGAIVKEPILQSEPVTNAKLVRGGEGGYMAVVLHPGMRAIAVPVSVNTAAGGFILPGDRIDLLQARQVDVGGANNGGPRPYVAQTILRNIRVLAIDQTAQAPKNGAQSAVGAVATLEVSPADAELVALSKAQGEMLLTLRSYADAGGPSGRAVGDSAVKIGTVRIVRNGQLSDTTVTP
jgi:pilus assembly protein CpaB